MNIKKVLIAIVLFSLINIVIYEFTNQDHNILYELDLDGTKALIEENYQRHDKQYYISIEINSVKYDLTLTGKQSRNNKIVDKIKYYNGDYQCILPLSKGKALTDVMCYKGGAIYNYASIANSSKELDAFINQLEEYNLDDWKSIKTSQDYQIEHFNSKINTYLTNYKGLTIIKNGKIKNIDLFKQDVYTQKIKAFLNEYYIVADYNETYEFKTFNVVNLKTDKVKKIESLKSISFNSYIQGIVDHLIYLYDVNNENQYVIDLSKSTVDLVDNNKVKFYSSDGWTEISKQKANKITLFEKSSTVTVQDYKYLDSTISANYFYQEKQDAYDIYFTSKHNQKIIKYLCTVSKLDNIRFNDSYAYYLNKDSIIIYNTKDGYQTLLTSKELEFNDSIDFYIY